MNSTFNIACLINLFIRKTKCDTNNISDGYHTFYELYNHRIELFIQLCHACKMASVKDTKGKLRLCWKSKLHSDGSSLYGWFIAGIGTRENEMITYHIPISRWDDLKVRVFAKAPKWDGHTSNDVINRLKTLVNTK